VSVPTTRSRGGVGLDGADGRHPSVGGGLASFIRSGGAAPSPESRGPRETTSGTGVAEPDQCRASREDSISNAAYCHWAARHRLTLRCLFSRVGQNRPACSLDTLIRRPCVVRGPMVVEMPPMAFGSMLCGAVAHFAASSLRTCRYRAVSPPTPGRPGRASRRRC
jgi:hypothetical protein